MRKTIVKTILFLQLEVLVIGWILIKHVEHQEQLLNSINDALVKPVVPCVGGAPPPPCPADLATPKITIQLDSNRRMTGVCVGACK